MPVKLGFAKVISERERWPWDLSIFLFQHSLSTLKCYRQRQIEQGAFGKPRTKRLPLLKKIHRVMEADLAAGGSYATLDTRARAFLCFYRFCDARSIDPTPGRKSLLALFQQWVAHETKTAEANGVTLYYRANNVATILARAVDMPVRQFLVAASITEPPREERVLSAEEDQNLIKDASNFVCHLVELIDNLSDESINGPLPITIRFSSGKQFLHYSLRRKPEFLRARVSADALRYRIRQRERLQPGSTPFDRRPLINLRFDAELLHFIAQTGMNLAQALKYPVGDFAYSSYLDGYKVQRRYKDRRKGEVEFFIYSEYRPYFEAYLKWRARNLVDPSDTRLFPFISWRSNESHLNKRKTFLSTREIIRNVGVPFVGPQKLRDIRVNYLDRRSSDASLAADIAQHTPQTLDTHYRRPHHARAASEITTFWRRNDPALQPAGPGLCVEGKPQASRAMPSRAPTPDCIGPAGCFFCIHHRDVATFDYVWSLASYRHLKSLELASQHVAPKSAASSPAQIVIERITQKLHAMEKEGETFIKWITEAILRVREEHFHPDWAELISLAEGV